MSERWFRRTQVRQIADVHVEKTVATAVMHDHVDLLVRAGYTDALAAAMHVVNSSTACVLCNELLHRRPRQSAVATVVFRGFGWYVSRSTEGRYFRHRCDAVKAS